jgi:chromosome segregation ATPase
MSSSSSSSEAVEGGGPLFTSDQISRAKTEWESTFRLLDEDIEAPGFRSVASAFLEAIARRSANNALQLERESKLLKELELVRAAQLDVKNTEDDANSSIRQARDDIEKLTADLASANEALHASNAIVAERKARIAGLEAQKQIGSGWTSDQNRDREMLESQLHGAAAALEAKRGVLLAARQDVNILSAHVEKALTAKGELDKNVSVVKESISAHRAQIAALIRSKETKDVELRSMQGRIFTLSAELKARTEAAEGGNNDVFAAQEALKQDKQLLDRLLKDYDRIKTRSLHLTDEIDEAMRQNQSAAAELDEMQLSSDSFRNDEIRLRREATKVGKLQVLTVEKIKATETKLAELEGKLSTLNSTSEQLVEDIRSAKLNAETQKQIFEDTNREKDVLSKALLKETDKAKTAAIAASAQQSLRRGLETEIQGYVTTLRKLRADADSLHESRLKLTSEAEAAAQSYFVAAEAVKLQELQVLALKKRLDEDTSKLRQHQKLYEEVKKERNDLSKQLVAAHAEIADVKGAFKDTTHRVETLKDDITSKDQALVKLHFEHHRVDTERDLLKAEVSRIRKQIQSCDHIIANQESEIKKLNAISTEAETEFDRQKKELNAVKSERALLLQQLEKRDVELSALYGKLQAQKSVLANGASSFARRATERDELAAKIATRKGELLLMTTQLSDTRALELECSKIESDLQREKAKIRALTEELERPINIHRWRALEDRDPEKWALILRSQNLQKRVLEARGEIRARDQAIHEAEIEYEELRGHLAKMPSASAGEESAEAIEKLQATLKAKTKQVKTLEAELETQRTLCDEHKRELARIEEALERLTQEYLRRRRAAAGIVSKRRQTSAGGQGSSLSHAAALASSMNRSFDDMSLGLVSTNMNRGGDATAREKLAEADRLLATYDRNRAEERKKTEEDSKV